MKKYITIIVLTLSALLANNSAIAGDKECEVFLCMAGAVLGAKPSECSGAVKSYFSILVKKHGSIKWSKTSSKRESFLKQCDGAEPERISDIQSKYGSSLGL